MEYFENDGLLFPVDEFIDPKALAKLRDGGKQMSTHYYRKAHCNNNDICLSMDRVGAFEMAPLSPYSGAVPTALIPFSEATSSSSFDFGVHFFIDDYQFERIWTNIHRYIPLLKKFQCVIGPDFSQFSDMSYPMRLWNSYRNRVVSAELQKGGVKLVPNVTWSLPDSYEYSFAGIPTDSIIAINCTSISTNISKYLWYKGYREALTRLRPKAIIRYGTKMPGETSEISYYFENERLKALRNGR